MTEFEEAVLAKLDTLIANQERSIRDLYVLNGIDYDHELYKAQYRNLQKRADAKRNFNLRDDDELTDLGIEVTNG